MRWRNSLDKIGITGSFIAAACCLGLPAIVSIVTAIGLGFLIKDAVLLPLMVVFLALTVLGLYLSFRVHRQPWPLILGSASSIGAFVFVFVHSIKFAAYLAIAGLVVASVWNVISRQKSAPATAK
jgi:mercuric ion transport protein